MLLARHELATRQFAIPRNGPNTSPRVREYLAPCVRDVDNGMKVQRLGLTEGNWCAAFASWCMHECLMPTDRTPHGYRAGVVEIVADAQAKGLWHTRDEVWRGEWTPHVGDLAIWDRSEPGKPETSWWRHVNRVITWDMTTGEPRFTTIGGNEARAIRITDHPPKTLTSQKLIGFVSYYQRATAVVLDRETRERNQRLVGAFVEAHRRSL